MSSREAFESMLTGGHPNSLGRTIEVVGLILADQSRLAELFACYRSNDEVVRLRTSNGLKRITKEHPDWMVPFIDPLLDDVSQLRQASAQWTLAQLMLSLERYLTPAQKAKAIEVLKNNLKVYDDWIVLNMTMQTLADWARSDPGLQQWLLPRLNILTRDLRKSVASKAKKLLTTLEGK